MHSKKEVNILISGATSGIGQAIAQELLARYDKTSTKLNLHLPCRNIEKAKSLYKAFDNKRIHLYQCDFSQLQSIKEFTYLLKTLHIDTVFNCAGSIETKHQLNNEGLSIGLCVNYLSHFLLTKELIEKQITPPKIITISGEFHRLFNLDFNKKPLIQSFHQLKASSVNMLYRIMWTKKLIRYYENKNLKAYCYHPGRIKTGLTSKLPIYLQLPLKLLSPFVFSSPQKGAQTGLWLESSSPENLVNGGYYDNLKIKLSSTNSRIIKNQDLLWEQTLELMRDFI